MTLSRTGVLIAEGDEGLRRRLYKRLLDHDVVSDIVTDGREALQRLDEHDYAVVLLDIDITVIDAHRVLDRLRAIDVAQRPITMVTAPRGTTPALDTDAVQIIIRKPFNVREVADVVKSCLTSLEAPKRETPSQSEKPRGRKRDRPEIR